MANKRINKKHNREQRCCVLCGNPLPSEASERVIGKTGRGACADCLRVSKLMLAASTTPHIAPSRKLIPSQLIAQLDERIIGQERAKRAVAAAMWKQTIRASGEDVPSQSILLYGPTGCGKTALVREAAKLSDLPFLAYDATTLTEAGYRGSSADDIIEELVDLYGTSEAAHAVVFIDEFDKLAAVGGEQRMAYSRGTQHSLLKLIEGKLVHSIDTSGILFIFGGAFSGLTMHRQRKSMSIGFDRVPADIAESEHELLPSDFVAYGMEPELMGRISRCVPLYALTESNLRRILRDSELSVFKRYRRFFEQHGRSLLPEDGLEDEIVREALRRGMGARGLNALLVEEWVEPKLLELAEGCQ